MLSNNIGDEIIMESVNNFVKYNFSDAYIWNIPTHERLSASSRNRIRNSSLCFIGGTNLISSDLNINGLWKISQNDCDVFKNTNTIALGVGWNDYTPAPTPRTARMLRKIFSKKYQSASRDEYTNIRLNETGVNSILTGCPTMWGLSQDHCRKVKRKSANSVVLTLTDWRSDRESDLELISSLRRLYKNIYFFPQMLNDLNYLKSLSSEGIKVISPTLAGFDTFLNNEDVDFVGTRLHGGIRALQKGKKTLIISVDNRSAEISKNTNLPVVSRKNFREPLIDWFEADHELSLDIPYDNINRFTSQFDVCVNPDAVFSIEDI